MSSETAPAPTREGDGGEHKRPPERGTHYGWITHTDLASTDPDATKEWARKVLGWAFRPAIQMPTGPLHLFSYSERGGGAIRHNNPPETPGSLPYVFVPDVDASYERAIASGASEMMAPETVMEGVRIAIVRAPGGVPIGFSGPEKRR